MEYHVRFFSFVVPNVINHYYGDQSITQTGGGGTEESTTFKPGKDALYGTRKVKSIEKADLPGYQEAWDDPTKWTEKDGKKTDKYGNVYSTFDEFQTAAKKWNKENPGYYDKVTEKDESYLISEATEGSYVTTIKKTKGPDMNATIKSNQNVNNTPLGKHTLGGYRAMKKNKK